MIKIVAVALIFTIVIVYLKSVNVELALLATVGAGIILLYFTIDYLLNVFDFINNLIQLSGIDNELYLIIFKITAIGYLVEFAASTIQDFGLKSLSDKLVFVGKILILSMSMPIIYAIFNLLIGMLQ